MKLTPFAQMLEANESVEVELSLIDDFPGHPFGVQADEDMERLIASIEESGVMVPVILRRSGDGRYQTVAGHRRCFACRQLSMEKIPAVVKEIPDEEAVIWMVDSNIQRTNIRPSEKAKAYRMKMEALARQGKKEELRPGLTSRQSVGKWQKETAEQVGMGSGDSGRKVQRYLRLNNLCSELLEKVDKKEIPFLSGVELSYLPKVQQKMLFQYLKTYPCSVSVKLAKQLRELGEKSMLSYEQFSEIFGGSVKKEKNTQKREDFFGKYFPEKFTREERRKVIESLLEKWKKGEIQL